MLQGTTDIWSKDCVLTVLSFLSCSPGTISAEEGLDSFPWISATPLRGWNGWAAWGFIQTPSVVVHFRILYKWASVLSRRGVRGQSCLWLWNGRGWSWLGRLENEGTGGKGSSLDWNQTTSKPASSLVLRGAWGGHHWHLVKQGLLPGFWGWECCLEMAVGLRWRLGHLFCLPAPSDAEGLLWRRRNRGGNSSFYSPKEIKRVCEGGKVYSVSSSSWQK